MTANATASPPAPRAMRASAPVSAASRRAWRGRACSACTPDRAGNALALAAALGGLKGPIMKVAQLLATIPDAVPPEYADELMKLQSEAPPMGWAFVKRRMSAELGADWEKKFELRASAGRGGLARPGASRARARRRSARLQAAISGHAVGGRSRSRASCNCCSRSRRRFDPAIDTSEIAEEIGERLREELDYVARGQARRALSAHARRTSRDPRAGGVAGALDRPAAHARLDGGHASCSPTRTTRSRSATASPPRCSPPGGCRSAATA